MICPLGAALAVGAVCSQAECSRPIVVPAAPTGFNVKVADEQVSGVYPDWLREVGRRAGCQIQFPVVPRARADSMTFVSGQADMLIPASQNQARDQKAQFVHLVNLTPTLHHAQHRAGTAQRLVHAGRPLQTACSFSAQL